MGKNKVNHYTIAYTVFDPHGNNPPKPEHKKYSFTSDSDLLGAAEEGMSTIFDQYEREKTSMVLFRSIELTNAKDVYAIIVKQEKAK